MPIVVVVIVLLLVVLIVFGLRLFSVERIQKQEKTQQEKTDLSMETESKEEELVNLVDYFDKKELDEPVAEKPKEEAAAYDPLCNLKIGKGYYQQCQNILNEAKADQIMHGVAYLDIDRFRFINNLKGYSIGDYCLTKTTAEMTSLFPSESLITRISADHFVIFFPILEQDNIAEYSERLEQSMQRTRSDLGIKSELRAAIGFALTQDINTDYNFQTLVHKANVARHCSKGTRAEPGQVFDYAMISSYMYDDSAMDDYSENQFADDIAIFFQPQQDWERNLIHATKSLVRWTCEDVGNNDFTNSRTVGKLPSNNCKVVYQVCKNISRWRSQGKAVPPVSVSLSVTDFYKRNIDSFVEKCISEFQISPKLLNIVVDASIVRIDWTASNKQIKKLRAIGVGFGVEGIGIDTLSLDFLAGLSVDFAVFTGNYQGGGESDCSEDVRRIIALAAAQNLRAIFAGVNSMDTVSVLKNAGVRYAGGLFCGKPLPADEYANTLLVHVERPNAFLDSTVITDEIDLTS